MKPVTNFERGVLLTLYEAGEENLPTLFNTAKKDFFPHVSPDEYEWQMNNTLQNFLKLRYIQLAYLVGSQWKNLSSAEANQLFPLSNCLMYDENEKMWRWNEKKMGVKRLFVLMELEGFAFVKNNIS